MDWFNFEHKYGKCLNMKVNYTKLQHIQTESKQIRQSIHNVFRNFFAGKTSRFFKIC